MTTQVSGDLRVITSTPAKITSVDVRSTTTRPSGDGLMLGQWVTLSKPGQFNAASGEVDFPAVPGPAQIKLFSGRSTVGSVALIVPDAPSASLADCVRNAEMAGDRDVGELAGILEQIRGSVGASAEARAGAEAAAVDAAGSAASAGRDAGRAETAEQGAVVARTGSETGQELSEDAAAVAVAAAVGAAEASSDKADTTYVDAQDQALGERIDGVHKGTRLFTEHLDTIKTPGQYWQDTKSVATPANGYPYYEQCSLQVLMNSAPDSQTVTQIIITKETHQIAVRDCDAGVWSEWTLYSNEATQLGVTDLDTLTTTQQRIATASTEVNSPNMPKPVRSIIDVVGAPGGSVVQTVTALGGVERWWRTRWGTGDWSPWYVDTISEVSLNDDLNEFNASGTYYGVSAATLISLKNMPETARFTLSVVGDGRWYASQTFTNVTNGRAWTRSLNVDTWSEWKENPVGGEAPGPEPAPSGTAGLTNRLLREDFTRRRGGRKRISTGAVAFRFDHGLANFDQFIRPLLEERGIPYSQALNSGSWDAAENDGITPEIVDGWVQGGLCEIWNHSRNHIGGVDMAEVEVEVVTGLEELREQLPSAQIDGFVIPGSGGRGFGPGFLMGADVQEFYGSEGGRMILEHHAVSTGYMNTTHLRILDGTIRQGMGHYTLDKGTLALAQTLIGYAQADKTGLQFMLHPSLVNTDGHITADVFAQILDLVVAERDAGRIHVCSPYDMYLLDVT